MANRLLTVDAGSLLKKVVKVYARVLWGATGAVTAGTYGIQAWNPATGAYTPAASNTFLGIAGISRTSAGLFVFTLQDRYKRCIGLQYTPVLAAGSFPAAPICQIATDNSMVATGSSPTVTVQFTDTATPSATDPADTEQGNFVFWFDDSGAL